MEHHSSVVPSLCCARRPPSSPACRMLKDSQLDIDARPPADPLAQAAGGRACVQRPGHDWLRSRDRAPRARRRDDRGRGRLAGHPAAPGGPARSAVKLLHTDSLTWSGKPRRARRASCWYVPLFITSGHMIKEWWWLINVEAGLPHRKFEAGTIPRLPRRSGWERPWTGSRTLAWSASALRPCPRRRPRMARLAEVPGHEELHGPPDAADRGALAVVHDRRHPRRQRDPGAQGDAAACWPSSSCPAIDALPGRHRHHAGLVCGP